MAETFVLFRPCRFVVRIPLVEALAERVLSSMVAHRGYGGILVPRIWPSAYYGESPPCAALKSIGEHLEHMGQDLQQSE